LVSQQLTQTLAINVFDKRAPVQSSRPLISSPLQPVHPVKLAFSQVMDP
jgi:hypothetical protein